MKEYMEREAARELIEQVIGDEWKVQYAIDRLNEIPVADVVEVVHCGECKHTETDGCGTIYCKKWDSWEIPSDFYCKYGERMQGLQILESIQESPLQRALLRCGDPVRAGERVLCVGQAQRGR